MSKDNENLDDLEQKLRKLKKEKLTKQISDLEIELGLSTEKLNNTKPKEKIQQKSSKTVNYNFLYLIIGLIAIIAINMTRDDQLSVIDLIDEDTTENSNILESSSNSSNQQNLESSEQTSSTTTTTTIALTTTTTIAPTTTTTTTTTSTTTTTIAPTTTTTTIPKIRPELPTVLDLSINRGGSGYIWYITVEFSEPYNKRSSYDKDFGSFYFKICKDPLGDNYLEYGCESEDEAWVKPESSLDKELLDDYTIRYSGYLYQRNVTKGYGSDVSWSTSFSQSSLIDKGGNAYWLVPVVFNLYLPHYGSDNCVASFNYIGGFGDPAKSIKYTSFRDRCPKISNDKSIAWDPFLSWNGESFNRLPAVKIFP